MAVVFSEIRANSRSLRIENCWGNLLEFEDCGCSFWTRGLSWSNRRTVVRYICGVVEVGRDNL